MTPLCKVEVTLPRFLGSRGVRSGAGVDEQGEIQPSRRAVAFSRVVYGSVTPVC
jgi:hypothetical protein